MNKRLKEIRKELKLSQEEFGDRLGVTKASISRLESGINNVTEQMIKSVCREFNVNYAWLKEGVGNMFIYGDVHSLDALAANQVASKEDIEFMRKYLGLSADARKIVRSVLKEVL